MFKIIDNPEFTHEVPVMVPTDGGHAEQRMKVRFRVIEEDEIALDVSVADGTKAFLRRAVVTIEDLVDPADRPVPWSDAVRDRLLQLPYVRMALLRAYNAAVTKARAGN